MTIDDVLLEDILHLKCNDLIPVHCKICKTDFNIKAIYARSMIKGIIKVKQYFCSRNCARANQKSEYSFKEISCKGCKCMFLRKNRVQKFCSKSCSRTYHNTHKTFGIKRSKLEKYIEEQLTILFPDLEISYNRKDTINSELDIYIPSLKLGVELNGIFHYEPIFSSEQLARSQNNDQRKMQACIERGIELCVIDTSHQTYFKPASSMQFLDIITHLVTSKLEASKTDYVEVM
jgi:hypothetical protein